MLRLMCEAMCEEQRQERGHSRSLHSWSGRGRCCGALQVWAHSLEPKKQQRRARSRSTPPVLGTRQRG